LEFNNLFASYKGEGTGAVRHMFAHHVLKPERVPIEANVWGTPKSSGSFSTMFEGRIRRALQYAADPFEIRVEGKRSTKVHGLSQPLGFDIATSYSEFVQGRQLYLSCGDSSETDVPDGSVDAVITDPPFFDNVHYSELADFFYVWQQHILGPSQAERRTTRSQAEVQSPDVQTFTDRLTRVLREAHRVLRDDGILAFTYHHSRADGWSSVLKAVVQSGFVISATQPIKAEMSVAMPKTLAKEPIDIDIIIVCRKAPDVTSAKQDWMSVGKARACEQVNRFRAAGRRLSRNDVRVILMSQLIRELSAGGSATENSCLLTANADAIEDGITELHRQLS
jgi:hypothetical protein